MKGNSSCDSSPNNQSERRDSHQRDDLCATWDSLKNWLIGFDGVGEHEEREREREREMIAELRKNFKFEF